MRALAALTLLVLATPLAAAQTLAVPIEGDYDQTYVVAGRAIDSRGEPVRGGIAFVQLDQEGVTAPPIRAGINCKGDFLVGFNLRNVDPRGKVTAVVAGPQGQNNGTATVELDPFYRRSNIIVQLPGEWRQSCVREQDVWAVSASLSVRLLNRTEPYELGGETFHARPYDGVIRLRLETPDGNTVCPPHPQDPTPGACESFLPDERGDLRYTFTLDQPFTGGGRIEILLMEGGSVSVDVDPRTRMGFGEFEITGQGPPPGIYDTGGIPGPGVVLVIALLALSAMAFSPRRR